MWLSSFMFLYNFVTIHSEFHGGMRPVICGRLGGRISQYLHQGDMFY